MHFLWSRTHHQPTKSSVSDLIRRTQATMVLTWQQNDVLPHDELSEAVYSNVKLNAIYANDTAGKESAMYTEDYVLDRSPELGTNLQSNPENIDENSSSLISAKSSYNPSSGLGPPQPSPRSSAPWKLRRVLAGAHQGWVRSLCVDPVTNSWFASGSADAQIKIWDLASADVKASITGHIMAVRALAVSSKYPYLFSGSEDKTLRCWDLERTNSPSGCQIRNYHGHVGGVYALALHPELDVLFSAGRDSAIRVWDIRSRAQAMVLTGHRSDVTSLVAQTGDPQVCSSSMDGTVRLWDLRMQKCHLTLTHHSKGVRSLRLHPHESTMVSADSSGNIKEWLLPGGQLLDAFESIDRAADANIINTLAINPATNELFAGYADGRMQFYDYESGRLLQQTNTNPTPGTESSTIYASAFDMSGMRLITGENDKSIKIWGSTE